MEWRDGLVLYWCSLFNCLLQDSRNLPYYLKMSYYKRIILLKLLEIVYDPKVLFEVVTF